VGGLSKSNLAFAHCCINPTLTCISFACCGLMQSVLKGIIALRTTPAAQSVTAAPLDLADATTVTSLLTVGACFCSNITR
jgi:hypothetical protein